MERTIQVRHVEMKVKADFEAFIKNLEASLGRFDPSFCSGIEKDPAGVRKRIEAAAGEEDFLIFDIRDHGRLLSVIGAPRKARQYVVGNPLIAVTMTGLDIRAGLYAPLRLYVYEAEDGSTMAEFDLPSSLFCQFNDPEITAIGESLDKKLFSLLEKAETAGMLAGLTPGQ